MTQRVEDWLPAGTGAPVALLRKIEALVDDWSRAWIALGAVHSFGVAPVVRRISTSRGDVLTRRAACDLVMLEIGKDAKRELGAAALGLGDQASSFTADDLDLIHRLADDIIADFERRFAVLASLPTADWDDAGSGGAMGVGSVMVEIGATTGQAWLRLLISAALFAKLVRASLPKVAPQPLGPAAQALGRSRVSVAALLGCSTLLVAELEALAIGDVLVLDRDAGSTVPIAVDGHQLAHGRCRIGTENETLALEIVAPLSAAA